MSAHHSTCVVRIVLSTGIGGMLYATTGIHGGHVLVGMLLILAYALQVHTWSTYSSTSTDSSHGVLSIMLYWHFVDGVWVSVVYLVYWAQLTV